MGKIFISGSNGFIGSHLVEKLLHDNNEIIAFDKYNFNNDHGWLNNSKYKKDIEFVLGDIRDFDIVNKTIQRCDKVIHLAALIGIPYSYISPLAYIRTNIEGTYNVLESAKIHSIDNIIITSTSEIYGSALEKPMNENHRINPQSPYASSKVAADQLSMSYYYSFELPVKIIRPFNVFGPRQSVRAVIPTIILQAIKKNKNIKLGNIKSLRDFTFVPDTCTAFEKCLNSNKFIGEITNVGSGVSFSIEDIVRKVSNITNFNLNFNFDKKRARPDKSEVNELICDNSKLKQFTDWVPKGDFDNNLKKTINWYEENIDKFNEDDYSV